MKSIAYKTGRFYDSEQVLDIKYRLVETDGSFAEYQCFFSDKSRNMSNMVCTVFGSAYMSVLAIGAQVLECYDAGQYVID